MSTALNGMPTLVFDRDDVLITADGPVVLTADCPKTIEDIERIVGHDLDEVIRGLAKHPSTQSQWTRSNAATLRLTSG